MAFVEVSTNDDPKIDSGIPGSMSIIFEDGNNASSDSLEEERELALEYIQNEIDTLYSNHEIRDGMILKRVQDPTEPTDLDNTIYLCEQCNGAYMNKLELNSHACILRPPIDSNISSEAALNYVPYETGSENITGNVYPIPNEPIEKPIGNQRKTKPRRKKFMDEAYFLSRRKDKGNNVCRICNKSLSKRSSLLIHMRRHAGEMPFNCNFCDRKFVVLYDLDRHMLTTHVTEKRYSCYCDICREPFISESGLLHHKRLRHKSDTLKACDICGQIFDGFLKLNNHKLEHETDDTRDPSELQVILLYEDTP